MGIGIGGSCARRGEEKRSSRLTTTVDSVRTWGAACCAPTGARMGQSRLCLRQPEQAPSLQTLRKSEDELGVVVMMSLGGRGILWCGRILFSLLSEADDFVVLVVGEDAN